MTNQDPNPAKPSAARLPLWRSMMYAGGNMSGQFLSWAFVTYLCYYYSPPANLGLRELLPIGVTTTVLAVGRILDGFLEPVVGYWSDRTRSRWGRRIPFIMFGGLPLCIFFMLLWLPFFPDNSALTTLQLVVTCTGFWFFFTITFCPYISLLPEIAQSSQDRVFISQLLQVFLMVATGVVMILPSMFKTNYGHPEMYIIFAVLALFSVYLPVIGIPERKIVGDRPHDEEYSILDALKWTFTNHAFLIYVISSLFMLLGFQTIMNNFMYLITVLLKQPGSFIATLFGVVAVSVFMGFFFIYKLSSKYSKKALFIVSYLLLGLFLPWLYFLDSPTIFGIPTL